MTVTWLLSACSQSPEHYHLVTQPSPNQDSRVQYLVLHYTQIDDASSLYELTRPESQVSAHYLLSREESQGRVTLYPLVAESQRAWHAGRSHWQGAQALNSASLGLEIVNQGYETSDGERPLDQRRWQPYTEAQFHAVGALLQARRKSVCALNCAAAWRSSGASHAAWRNNCSAPDAAGARRAAIA